MQKIALSIVAVLVLAGGGWFGYQQYARLQVQHAEQASAAAAAAKQRAFVATAEVARKKQIAAAQVARQEIEGALKPLKVTSILPGNPGLAIIDKTEYAEGDNLTLAGGKQLLIASIKESGVFLASNGLTFHLDPPAEPDLAATRKGK